MEAREHKAIWVGSPVGIEKIMHGNTARFKRKQRKRDKVLNVDGLKHVVRSKNYAKGRRNYTLVCI